MEVETGKRLSAIPAGSKKLHRVMLKCDSCLVVAWEDCSFDLYDINRGQLTRQVEAPDSQPVTIQSWQLTMDGDLVALTKTKVTATQLQRSYSLWFWDTENERAIQVRCTLLRNDAQLSFWAIYPFSFRLYDHSRFQIIWLCHIHVSAFICS